MSYPARIDTFNAKINKKINGAYVIEEESEVVNGVWEGFLKHDNANIASIQIFTGSRLSGEQIQNYFVSVPEEMPWKRHLKVFAQVEKVYVTYETPGDQVEAEDINTLQDAITNTQKEIERYKKFGIIDGGSFIRQEE